MYTSFLSAMRTAVEISSTFFILVVSAMSQFNLIVNTTA